MCNPSKISLRKDTYKLRLRMNIVEGRELSTRELSTRELSKRVLELRN